MCDNQERFIPVYTGNIKRTTSNVFQDTVYPCVYREHAITSLILLAVTGLSLCIQGTFRDNILNVITFRFIPVYTGNMLFFNKIYNIVNGLSLCIQGTFERLSVCVSP